MKVSASPFEAPVGTVRSGEKQADRLRGEERDAALHLVRATSSSQSVRAGLDSATKEALKQLAEKLKSEKDGDGAGEQPANGGSKRSLGENKHSNQQKATNSLAVEGTVVAAVSKLQKRFEIVRQQRGREVYRQASRERVIHEIESQLSQTDAESEDPLELILNLGADFLESDESAGAHAPPSKSALKRVA